jgi:hypothetical protein
LPINDSVGGICRNRKSTSGFLAKLREGAEKRGLCMKKKSQKNPAPFLRFKLSKLDGVTFSCAVVRARSLFAQGFRR